MSTVIFSHELINVATQDILECRLINPVALMVRTFFNCRCVLYFAALPSTVDTINLFVQVKLTLECGFFSLLLLLLRIKDNELFLHHVLFLVIEPYLRIKVIIHNLISLLYRLVKADMLYLVCSCLQQVDLWVRIHDTVCPLPTSIYFHCHCLCHSPVSLLIQMWCFWNQHL